jgi:predicted ester cyclase
MQTTQSNHPSLKWIAAFDRRDWPALMELTSPQIRARIGSMDADRDRLRQFGEMFAAAFPDAKHDVQAFHVAGEYATVVATFSGTHKAELMGIPATNRRVSFGVVHVDRVVDGRLVEHRGEFDSAGLMQQLTHATGPATDPRALVEEIFRRIDGQDQDGALALATPDFMFQFGDQVMNGQGWKEFSKAFFLGIPDGRHTFTELYAHGDRVTGVGTFTGTHRGTLMGLPATNRSVKLGYICVMQLRDGKLAGIKVQADSAGMMQQLTS